MVGLAQQTVVYKGFIFFYLSFGKVSQSDDNHLIYDL
jgi:hypothetical protein